MESASDVEKDAATSRKHCTAIVEYIRHFRDSSTEQWTIDSESIRKIFEDESGYVQNGSMLLVDYMEDAYSNGDTKHENALVSDCGILAAKHFITAADLAMFWRMAEHGTFVQALRAWGVANVGAIEQKAIKRF